MHATSRPTRITPQAAAQAAADYLGLPTARLTTHNDAAHIFTADMHHLTAWYRALGGTVTRERAGLGVTLWTLRTHTEPRNDGTHTPILIHCLALTTEDIDPTLTNAAA
ncbi:hypothetical protein OV320_2607 [Actinobacteria bacterium OV320]|jgi:hypothetical protein|nr:hypothetical protein OV320_2607 [Actinobacteria bacterium OV320]